MASGRWVAPTVPNLGDGHLVFREHFEQKSFELRIRAVDLVDREHSGDGALEGLQERAGDEKPLAPEGRVGLRDAVGGFSERAHRDELAGDDVA